MSEFTEFAEGIEPIVREVGEQLRPHFGAAEELERKADDTPVTELDRAMEEFLAARLTKLVPEAGVYGEELGKNGSEEQFFLIDPIDGTHHFICGLPFCTVMVAYVEGGAVRTSAIYNFTENKYFAATEGKGATCNGEQIHVSNRQLSEGRVALETIDKRAENWELRKELFSRTRQIQIEGSGYELTLVASGAIEAKVVVDGFGQAYDFAPGALLVQEAGGVVTNLGSESYDYRNLELIAANPCVHRELTDAQTGLSRLKDS